ncbi:hypothetical protein TWF696_005455 [Orbilia brochopaga]|uniref:Egg coat matrix protein n=1 Tax=Orbilia brochopaga TaxID=3140254 RepID=A0AAV9V3J1_9PEZI
MPTRTIEPNVFFAIEVVIDEQGVGPQGTQYLLIAKPYVILFPGPPLPPWYLDDARNLVFDHTGLNLAIAPLDLPPAQRSLRARDGDSDDEYETIVVGNTTMPPGGQIFSKWIPGPPSGGVQQLYVVDDLQRTADLTFLACNEDAPKFNRTFWQLEAAYDYRSAAPTSCVPVKLLASVPASTSTPSPTVTYTPTAISSATSSTSASPQPKYFPIIVDIAGALERRSDLISQSDDVWYLTQDEGPQAIRPVARRNIKPPYWYENQRRELVNAASGWMLEFNLLSPASPSKRAVDSETTTFDRFAILANNTIEILYDAAFNIEYLACQTDPIGNGYNLSAAFLEDIPSLLSENPDCIVVEISADTDAPIPTTIDVTTTVESTTTPYQTVTALDPNISGCNAVDYSEAYATPSADIGEFATACFCWSFVAETVSVTSTVSCTPTVIEIEASITSISVSGVLSADSDDSVATDGEGLSRRAAVAQDTDTDAATGMSGDIIAIPTPPDLESLVTADPSAVSDVCTQLLRANGVDGLTITTVDVLSLTVADTTSTTTSVQTVCWEMGTVVYPTGIVSTPVAVICPATVTGA